MKKPEKGLCRVYDQNAIAASRVHDVAGVQYSLFAHGDGTLVPLHHALQFLRDPAFVVFDPDGHRMEMQGPAVAQPDIKLPPHQTVANLDELAIDSLLVRAKKLPGSTGLSRNAGKKRLIQFIMAGGIAADIEVDKSDPAGDDDDLTEDSDVAGHGDGDIAVADRALESEDLAVF